MADSKKLSCEETKEMALSLSDKIAQLDDFGRGYIQGRIDERIEEKFDENDQKQTA